MIRGWAPTVLFVGFVFGGAAASADEGPELGYEDLFPSAYCSASEWYANTLERCRAPNAQPPAAPDPRWTDFRIQALQTERRNLHLARPALTIALSALGVGAGSWLLAIGIEGPRGPRDLCDNRGWWMCVSRPAPYAGTVFMGISVFGLVRAGKKLRAKAHRKRQLDRELTQLHSQ